ncbi:DUF4232 domain-containing protein [Microbacterium sp. NPDC057659]|uniref:DUF4232 domain-containing protein n=1 Tax=Microbacterium sp. NPDC057659 TaxID=3346198 RepID=UPI00366F2E38
MTITDGRLGADAVPAHASSRWLRGALSAGALAAALWMLSGWLHVIGASNVYVSRALSLLAVAPQRSARFSWPMPWSVLALLTTAAVIVTVVFFVLRLDGARRRPGMAIWFAVIIAGTVLGLATDATSVLADMPRSGWRALLSAGVDAALSGAYWGVVQGWIPAVALARWMRGSAPERPGIATAAAALLAALILFAVLGVAGTSAWRSEVAQKSAEAQGLSVADGAYPDPQKPGTPPPTAAPGVNSPVLDDDWCTAERATLLIGASDAGLGHRVQEVQLMNSSDTPCVLEGYADIAFADQNGHDLPVKIEPGSSYMASDPGPARIEIPAKGYASMSVSWNANSTNGALVARTMYAAILPGLDRGSWPVQLDIVPDTALEISAWHLIDTPGQ